MNRFEALVYHVLSKLTKHVLWILQSVIGGNVWYPVLLRKTGIEHFVRKWGKNLLVCTEHRSSWRMVPNWGFYFGLDDSGPKWTSILMVGVIAVVPHPISLRVASSTLSDRWIDYLDIIGLVLPRSFLSGLSFSFLPALSMPSSRFLHKTEKEFSSCVSSNEFSCFYFVEVRRSSLESLYPNIRVSFSGMISSFLIHLLFMQFMVLLFVQGVDMSIGGLLSLRVAPGLFLVRFLDVVGARGGF